jgi:hypothetical protein
LRLNSIKLELPEIVASNTEHFVGRTWLLSHILNWLDKSNQRLFILQGGPGSGKSTIVAWLAGIGPLPAGDTNAIAQLKKLRSRVKAAHFFMSNTGNTAPKAFAEDIAKQLTQNINKFGDALAASLAERVQIVAKQKVGKAQKVTGVYISKLDLSGLTDEFSFDRVLRDPLKRLYDESGYNETILLLVDALDEALTYRGGTNIVQLFSKLEDLPKQVRILATTRGDPRVLKYFTDIKPFDIIKDAPPEIDDVKSYATKRLVALGNEKNYQQEILADKVSKAADGNFLYAHLVIDDLLKYLPNVKEVEKIEFPSGLNGIYRKFLNRELGADEDRWYNTFKPLLGLIAVSQGEGLTRNQLQEMVGREIEQTLRICKQYLQGALPEGPFRLFHKSFADFLFEEKENIHYHIDAASMHQKIVTYYKEKALYWKDVDWTRVDDYGLLHLATHAYELRDNEAYREESYRLICKSFMQEKVDRFRSHHSFSADVKLAIEAAYSDKPLNLVQLVRGAFIHVNLETVATNIPPEALWVLTMVGNEAKAKDIAALITETLKMEEAYHFIGEALLEREEIDKAKEAFLHILEPVEEEIVDIDCLRHIGPALVIVGERHRMLKLVKMIEDKLEKDSMLGSIAYGLAEKGKFNQAIEITTDIENKSVKDEVLRDIIGSFAQNMGLKLALKVVEEIEEPFYNAFIQSYMAIVLADTGDSKQADKMVSKVMEKKLKAITYEIHKVVVLSQVAHVLIQIGKKEQANVIANQIMSLAELMDNEVDKMNALSLTHRIFKDIGEVTKESNIIYKLEETATEIVNAAKENPHIAKEKEKTLIEIARILAWCGEYEIALKLANTFESILDNFDLRWRTIYKIVYTLAHGAKLDEAFNIARRFGFCDHDFLSNLSKDLAKHGQFETALKVLEGMHFVTVPEVLHMENDFRNLRIYSYKEVFRTIADAMILNRERNNAREIANVMLSTLAEIESFRWPYQLKGDDISILSSIAVTLVLVGEMEKAKDMVNRELKIAERHRSQKQEGLELGMLEAIAESLARVGESRRALMVVERMPTNSEKVSTLSLVAKVLAKGEKQLEAVEAAYRALNIATEEPKQARSRGFMLHEAAIGLIWAGQVHKAMSIVEDISDIETSRPYTLVKIVDALVESGQNMQLAAELATKVIRLTNDVSSAVRAMAIMPDIATIKNQANTTNKAHSIKDVVKMFAHAGEIDEALKAADNIYNKEERDSVLDYIIQVMIQRGDELTKVQEVAQKINDEYCKAGIMLKVAKSLARSGDKVKATEIVNQLLELGLDFQSSEASLHDVGVTDLLKVMAELGQYDQLCRIADETKIKDKNFWNRMHVMSCKAMALAKMNQCDQAISLWGKELKFQSIDSSEERFKLDNFLEILGMGAPFITSLDQGRTLWKIYEAVVEVESWWTA